MDEPHCVHGGEDGQNINNGWIEVADAQRRAVTLDLILPVVTFCAIAAAFVTLLQVRQVRQSAVIAP